MNAVDALFAAWRGASPVARRCIELVRSSSHGDLPRWLWALERLPDATPSVVSFGDVVTVGAAADLAETGHHRLDLTLRELQRLVEELGLAGTR